MSVERSHGAPRGVLGIGLILVHVTPAETIDDDPGDLDVGTRLFSRDPVRESLGSDSEWILGVRMLETVDAVVMPHVPERSADLLRHDNAIPRIAHIGCAEHRLFLPELPLHIRIRLEAAAGEHDGAARLDGDRFTLVL